LAFLVLLIVATAIMFAWLLVSVTRFAIGDLHLPGLHWSPARPVSPPPREGGTEAPAIVDAPDVVAPDPHSDPEMEAERAVREHLYGRRGRPR
jgi:hypothetical protein